MSQKNLKGLASTIILGTFLMVALSSVTLLYVVTYNYEEFLEATLALLAIMPNQTENWLTGILVSILLFFPYAIWFLLVFITLFSSSIPIIFSIKNYKCENKVLMIINIIYSVLFSAISLLAQVNVGLSAIGAILVFISLIADIIANI